MQCECMTAQSLLNSFEVPAINSNKICDVLLCKLYYCDVTAAKEISANTMLSILIKQMIVYLVIYLSVCSAMDNQTTKPG